ncbi:MAG: hypothetical protein GY866_36415 [Proteobacteria bacterium]|nr:hypothetical protein [Pseudomonadota bacterium]
MFDIATSMFPYAHQSDFETVKAAFVEGYRRLRNLPDEHLETFDLFLLLRLMTACGWVHTRPENETARQFGAGLAVYLLAKVDEYLAP